MTSGAQQPVPLTLGTMHPVGLRDFSRDLASWRDLRSVEPEMAHGVDLDAPAGLLSLTSSAGLPRSLAAGPLPLAGRRVRHGAGPMSISPGPTDDDGASESVLDEVAGSPEPSTWPLRALAPVPSRPLPLVADASSPHAPLAPTPAHVGALVRPRRLSSIDETAPAARSQVYGPAPLPAIAGHAVDELAPAPSGAAITTTDRPVHGDAAPPGSGMVSPGADSVAVAGPEGRLAVTPPSATSPAPATTPARRPLLVQRAPLVSVAHEVTGPAAGVGLPVSPARYRDVGPMVAGGGAIGGPDAMPVPEPGRTINAWSGPATGIERSSGATPARPGEVADAVVARRVATAPVAATTTSTGPGTASRGPVGPPHELGDSLSSLGIVPALAGDLTAEPGAIDVAVERSAGSGASNSSAPRQPTASVLPNSIGPRAIDPTIDVDGPLVARRPASQVVAASETWEVATVDRAPSDGSGHGFDDRRAIDVFGPSSAEPGAPPVARRQAPEESGVNPFEAGRSEVEEFQLGQGQPMRAPSGASTRRAVTSGLLADPAPQALRQPQPQPQPEPRPPTRSELARTEATDRAAGLGVGPAVELGGRSAADSAGPSIQRSPLGPVAPMPSPAPGPRPLRSETVEAVADRSGSPDPGVRGLAAGSRVEASRPASLPVVQRSVVRSGIGGPLHSVPLGALPLGSQSSDRPVPSGVPDRIDDPHPPVARVALAAELAPPPPPVHRRLGSDPTSDEPIGATTLRLTAGSAGQAGARTGATALESPLASGAAPTATPLRRSAPDSAAHRLPTVVDRSSTRPGSVTLPPTVQRLRAPNPVPSRGHERTAATEPWTSGIDVSPALPVVQRASEDQDGSEFRLDDPAAAYGTTPDVPRSSSRPPGLLERRPEPVASGTSRPEPQRTSTPAPDLDTQARLLWPRLRAMLLHELRIDRERSGTLRDTYR